MIDYSDLLIMQYRKKPKAVATIKAFTNETNKQSENLLDLLDQWDIDKARGFSLDIIGHRVGVSRRLVNAIPKGYLGYYGSQNSEPWGRGVWYRRGETFGDSVVLTDSDFRFLIKAKILKNFQNGTFDYVMNALRILLGEDALLLDGATKETPENMTADIYIPINYLNAVQNHIIRFTDILPRPMGVKYNFINISGKEFGFDRFVNSYGFNQGKFIDA